MNSRGSYSEKLEKSTTEKHNKSGVVELGFGTPQKYPLSQTDKSGTMNRIFGTKKKAPEADVGDIPKIGDSVTRMDGRVEELDKKVSFRARIYVVAGL